MGILKITDFYKMKDLFGMSAMIIHQLKRLINKYHNLWLFFTKNQVIFVQHSQNPKRPIEKEGNPTR